ncbi:hypothetical protein [Myroides marinus]|uniref:hypothetical protein n=1 Tax=Myroides marinus TaxID=703342 RepID=UPI000A49E60C|nr:hypothetical protein [Myroides marinus]
MRHLIMIIVLLLSFGMKAQTVQIKIPETYELSNIILALTKYGIEDKWEVQKNTAYYQDVLKHFNPVKNHPLLDCVNYSREKWEDYLSFRTDAVAFSFDDKGKLKRDFDFYTNLGHDPFDKNLELINDFVEKSRFREFYNQQQAKGFYSRIINNYEEYNFMKESLTFLDTRIGQITTEEDKDKIYRIYLSPLVNRMNCHRDISKNIVADFPSATEDFINGVVSEDNLEERLNSNHLIFTEKDHEYINPITFRNLQLVTDNFNTKYWDNNSGYNTFNSFNEYMTWAVYDLFLEEYFPQQAAKHSINWQYQNAERGFFAQNLFSEKVKELYKKNKDKDFEQIYLPLLQWAKSIEENVTLPTLVNVDTKNFVKTNPNNIQLEFSEPMDSDHHFSLEIMEFKDNRSTNNKKHVEITNPKWSTDKKVVTFSIDTDYNEFALIFNWWGIDKPILSKRGIFLAPRSYILLKK